MDNGAGTGNVTTSTTATHCTCKTFICTGYVGTLNVRTTITVAGNVTLVSGMTITSSSGTPILTVNTTATITSNGKVWPHRVNFSGGTITYTFVGDFEVDGLITLGPVASTSTNTYNKTTSEKIIANGGISCLYRLTGSVSFELRGGIWSSGSSTSGYMGCALSINGNITLGTNICTGSATITHTSGTVTSAGNTMHIPSACTLNLNNATFNNVSITASITVTLTSDFTANGLTTIGSGLTQVINRTTAEIWYTTGIAANGAFSGTAEVILIGGTWSGSNTTGISNNLTFQGNVTVSGTVYYRAGTLKYTSGTITVTSSTLTLQADCTLNTSGMTWNAVTTSTTTAQTYTINSTLSAATLNLAVTNAQTFAGTAGFSVATLSCAAVSVQTINLKESITYTITTLLSCYLSRTGSIVLFTSSHASTKANLVLQNGATCQCLASFTRIDSSGGRPIRSFNGVVTDCTNVVSFYDLKTVAG